MWDYVAQTRQDTFRQEADARRLIRLARGERPSLISMLGLAVRNQLSSRLQPRTRPTFFPNPQAQEMQPCVDA